MVGGMFVWSKLSAEKWRDAWEERFLGVGRTNAVITAFPGRPTIRVEVWCETGREAEAIRKQFGGMVRRVARAEWLPAAPPAPRILRIRGRLLVINTEDQAAAAALRAANPRVPVLQIPAALAFGTGDHATTATCLRLLADEAARLNASGAPWTMADLGTGTGILALAGRCLGAAAATGMDNDPAAVKAAKANARLNRVRDLAFVRGDLLEWDAPQAYPLVAANVFAGILVKAMPRLVAALAADGRLILSGILNDQAGEVEAAGCRHGLEFLVRRAVGKWTTLLARPRGRKARA
jgi:ribosomal protein L11 methyltransferase